MTLFAQMGLDKIYIQLLSENFMRGLIFTCSVLFSLGLLEIGKTSAKDAEDC